MNGDVRTVVLVAVGVILAGLAMRYGRDFPILSDAVNGFDGG